MEDVKISKSWGMVLKLDFGKVYDMVCWGCLDKVFPRSGVGGLVVVLTPHPFSAMVNG